MSDGEQEATNDKPVSTSARASSAKAANGDAPALAYIASLPDEQRAIAEAVDALASRTLPNLQRSVKWGMAYYGVGDGWCFSCGAYGDQVKVMFINAATLLDPVPPVTPVGMGKATRGIEVTSLDELDEVQLAEWMRQATSQPGVGKR